MNKEIEEMSAYLSQFTPILSENNCRYVAERAYKDGYRRKSEDMSNNSEVMSNKEIEELAAEIYTLFQSRPMSRALAHRLYDKGWRKQSENTVKLPCNIGDSCYPLPWSKKPIVERKVSRITFSKRNVIIGYYENDGQYRPPLRTRILGEDVFLTQEEAEAKMKGGAG